MEYEKIKQLMEDMGNSKLSLLSIDFPDGTKISIEKEPEQEKNRIVNIQPQIETNLELEQSNSKAEENILKAQENKQIQESEKIVGNIVKSPMVGTFYLKSSPNSNPYVEVGKQVKKGNTLCIIEAMKLMNEIESEYEGEITQILVKDGDAVEYGTQLFVIQ